jgi:hypothetical protein
VLGSRRRAIDRLIGSGGQPRRPESLSWASRCGPGAAPCPLIADLRSRAREVRSGGPLIGGRAQRLRGLGRERESRVVRARGTCWCADFARSAPLGLQPAILRLRRNHSSPSMSILPQPGEDAMRIATSAPQPNSHPSHPDSQQATRSKLPIGRGASTHACVLADGLVHGRLNVGLAENAIVYRPASAPNACDE